MAWQPSLWLLTASVVANLTAAGAAELSRVDGGGVRWTRLQQPLPGRSGFRLLPATETGLNFTNTLTDLASAENRVLENGSGVATGDYDGDDRPDVLLCALSGNTALFRNLGGWRFTNVTESAGLGLAGEVCRGAVFADLDGDRRPDLLVSTLSRGVRCFLNEGGRFRDATADSGLSGKPGSTTLALADVDGDGTVDLYVTRYRAEDIRDQSQVEIRRVQGRTELHPKYAGRLILGGNGLLEFGEPDSLYLNDGRARFTEASWTDGRFLDENGKALEAAPMDWGLTASFRDLNGDGLPDLYVCNDYWTPDRLWLNAGAGRFRAAPREALRHTSENSMGVDFADIDRDGHVDFLVLDMLSRDTRRRRRQALAQTPMPSQPGEILNRPQIMQNTLFRNRGDGTFAEVAHYARLAASDWSWQPLFLDVDLDGFEDVVIPAGHRRDVQDLDATERIRALQRPRPAGLDPASRQAAFTREMMEHARIYPSLEMPIVAFRNHGDLRFEQVTESWGLAATGVHQGMAAADFDQDGDLDLVVNNLNGNVGLYRNEGAAPRVAVRLRGLPPNTEGIGARVRLIDGPLAPQTRERVAGGRYLSGCQPLMVFAAGSPNPSWSIEVTWRNGRVSRVPDVRPNHLCEIDEAGARLPSLLVMAPEEPLFEDVSERLGHAHREDTFDDLARQPLLPRRLSQLGPAAAWCDLNGDGWDDLVIGTGAGGRPGVFTNDTRGRFASFGSWTPPALPSADQAGIVALMDPSRAVRLLVGNSSYETGGNRDPEPAVVEQTRAGARIQTVLAPNNSSPGPLALADVDGDGDLDLFVGGRVIGGRYPEPASSHLLLQEALGWRLDETNAPVLNDAGLVTGAVWADLDDDGDSDLILAVEWGPLRVLRNDRGLLLDVTEALGLSRFRGWWNSVTVADLDGDGRLDLVGGNWGLNSAHSRGVGPDRPVVCHYGDFLKRGTVDLLESEWDPLRNEYAPRHSLDRLQLGLPSLRTAFPAHRGFSEVSTEALVRSFDAPVRRLEADTLASMVFFNRGSRFEPSILPMEAQLAPAFGLAVADFDGDGFEDLFLAQNFFALPWQDPRSDAGQGLFLRGRKDGRLTPLSARESGLRLLGEQRAAAVADFDRDGRPDLVVTQNGTSTGLYRNRRGSAGTRVHLEGPPGNPAGVGAVVRPRYASGWGPARAVLAGAGYWSQDSATLVLGGRESLTGLTVRWPDGTNVEVQVPKGSREIWVKPDGAFRSRL